MVFALFGLRIPEQSAFFNVLPCPKKCPYLPPPSVVSALDRRAWPSLPCGAQGRFPIVVSFFRPILHLDGKQAARSAGVQEQHLIVFSEAALLRHFQ